MSTLLKSTLETISNEFNNYNEFKDNYDILLTLPIVRKLLEENRKLKMENEIYKNAHLQMLMNVNQTISTPVHVQVPIPVTIIKEEKVDKVEVVEVVKKIEEVIVPDEEDSHEQDVNPPFIALNETKALSEDEATEEEDEELSVGEELGEHEEFVTESDKVKEVEPEDEEEQDEEEEELENDTDAVDEVKPEATVEEEDNEEAEEAEEDEEEQEENEEEGDDKEEEVAEDESEDEQEEEKEEEQDEGDEEDEDVVAVVIKGVTYYTTDPVNGIIYGVDEDGDISLEVGKFNNKVATMFNL